MKRVLLLGNGFDLDLGLPTSYKSYLQSSYFPTGQTLINEIKQKYDIQNWIDLEEELSLFAIRYAKENKDKRFIMSIKQDFDALCLGLRNYLKTLNFLSIDKTSNAAKLLTILSKDPELSILTYNYTSLDFILKELGGTIPSYKHVHGSLNNDNIILGCEADKNIPKHFNYFLKTGNPRYRSANVRETLIEADQIFIYGLSLGKTDYHYFDELFSMQSSRNRGDFRRKLIRIFTKNEESHNDLSYNIRSMINGSIEILSDRNDFAIYCIESGTTQDEINSFLSVIANDICKTNKPPVIPAISII